MTENLGEFEKRKVQTHPMCATKFVKMTDIDEARKEFEKLMSESASNPEY